MKHETNGSQFEKAYRNLDTVQHLALVGKLTSLRLFDLSFKVKKEVHKCNSWQAHGQMVELGRWWVTSVRKG